MIKENQHVEKEPMSWLKNHSQDLDPVQDSDCFDRDEHRHYPSDHKGSDVN